MQINLNNININKVNFTQKREQIDIPDFVQNKPEKIKQNNQKDEFVKTKNKKSSTSKTIKASSIKGFIVGLAAMGSAWGFNKIDNIPKQPKVIEIQCNDREKVKDIIEDFDISEEVLCEFNNIEEIEELNYKNKAKIPVAIDLMQEKIDSLVYEIRTEKFNKTRLNEKLAELDELKELQKVQNQVAQVYTDNKYIYFYINEGLEYLPESINPYESNNINVERFKSLYGIKDKALKQGENFNLFDIGYTDNGKLDFASETFTTGDCIKIKKNKLNINKASLDSISPTDAKEYKY